MRFMRSLSAFCVSKYAFWECHFTLEIDTFHPPKKGSVFGLTRPNIIFFRIISAHNARFLFLFTLELRWVKYNIFWNRVFQHTMLGFDFYLPRKNDGSKIIAPFFGLFLPAKIIVLVNFLRKFRDFSGVWIFLWERWSFLIGNEIAKKMSARARGPRGGIIDFKIAFFDEFLGSKPRSSLLTREKKFRRFFSSGFQKMAISPQGSTQKIMWFLGQKWSFFGKKRILGGQFFRQKRVNSGREMTFFWDPGLTHPRPGFSRSQNCSLWLQSGRTAPRERVQYWWKVVCACVTSSKSSYSSRAVPSRSGLIFFESQLISVKKAYNLVFADSEEKLCHLILLVM